MRELVDDWRYSRRVLSKAPGFSAAVILVLAVGIAANTVVFSMVDAAFFNSLPYSHPEQLVTFSRRFSFPELAELRDGTRAFSGIVGYRITPGNVTFDGLTRRDVAVCEITGDLFRVLGVTPLRGRSLLKQELLDNARVAILNDSALRLLAAAPSSALGTVIRIGDVPYTVVGVMPKRFAFPPSALAPRAEIWIPFRETAQLAEQRSARVWQVVARLAPGISLLQAQTQMRIMDARYRESQSGLEPTLVSPVRREIADNTGHALMALMGAVGFVLLIVCTNIGMLLVSRASRRQKEVAIRIAIGAPPGRIARQLVMEALTVGLAGGSMGFVLAVSVLRLLEHWTPAALSHLPPPHVDLTVLAFTVALSVLTSIIFGLMPALQLAGTDVVSSLGERMRPFGLKGRTFRNLLLVCEVAATLVLLVGAGLLIQTVMHYWSVPIGFSPSNVVVGLVELPLSKYPKPEQWQAHWSHLLEDVRALPGVRDASVVNGVPFWGYSTMEVAAGDQERWLSADVLMVGPRYFATMGVPLLKGRDFTDFDRVGRPPVVIVNEAMHRKIWPSMAAVGQRMVLGISASGVSAEVVGEVADIHQRGFGTGPQPTVYVPYAQLPSPAATLVVRTSGDAKAMVRVVAHEIQRADPVVTFSNATTMREVLSNSIASQRLASLVFTTFAAIALFLAIIGVFAFTAYTVASHIREIGIRLAFGATSWAIYRLLLRQSVAPVIVGVAIGSGLSIALGTALRGLLFGVAPADPVTLVSCAVGLLLTSCAASLIPARRATRADPAVVLRA